MSDRIPCICGLPPAQCVCGLHVPDIVGFDPSDLRPAARIKPRVRVRAKASVPGPEEGAAAAGASSAGADGSSAAPESAASTDAPAKNRLFGAARLESSFFFRQEQVEPPDLQAQLRAAVVLEAQRLEGAKAGKRGAGRPSASASAYVPPSAEDLGEEEAEVYGEYCDLQLGEQLVAACAEGGDEALAEARGLLAEEAVDPEYTSVQVPYCGSTPLVEAARHGHSLLIAELIAAGAKPDSADVDGVSALLHACKQGHAHAACLLLDAGASAAAVDDEGVGLLAAAVSEGHEGVVTMLLDLASAAPADGGDAVPAALAVRAQLCWEIVEQAHGLGFEEMSQALRRALQAQGRRPEEEEGEGGGRVAGAGYVGRRLQLHSFETRAELNGHFGKVTAWDDSTGTFTLTLEANAASVTASHWHVRAPGDASRSSPEEKRQREEGGASTAAASAQGSAATEAAAGEGGEGGAARGAEAEDALPPYDVYGSDERGEPIWQRKPLWLSERGGPVTSETGAPVADAAAGAPAASAAGGAAGSGRGGGKGGGAARGGGQPAAGSGDGDGDGDGDEAAVQAQQVAISAWRTADVAAAVAAVASANGGDDTPPSPARSAGRSPPDLPRSPGRSPGKSPAMSPTQEAGRRLSRKRSAGEGPLDAAGLSPGGPSPGPSPGLSPDRWEAEAANGNGIGHGSPNGHAAANGHASPNGNTSPPLSISRPKRRALGPEAPAAAAPRPRGAAPRGKDGAKKIWDGAVGAWVEAAGGSGSQAEVSADGAAGGKGRAPQGRPRRR